MYKLFLTIFLLCLISNALSEEYYRSVDRKGKVQYGDAPAKDATEVQTLNSRSAPKTDDSLPFEIARANAKFPVTLYVADGCGIGCAQAHDFLKKRGIPFTEKNLVTADDISAFKIASGGNQVPLMHIGSEWITGFLESRWAQALDTAGYPNHLPYGFTPPVKYIASPEKPVTP